MAGRQDRVLLVEDDHSIRRGLKATLSALQFGIGEASTGEEALLRLRAADYDIVLMDLNMSGMGGIEACRCVRREFPKISILVVTVCDREEDTVEALDAGADDYVTKPFQINELLARMRAVLRRSRNPAVAADESISVGKFELFPARRVLKKSGDEIYLTPTEFDLVAHLMIHANHPVMHAKLLSAVWGSDHGGEKEYLRTFIMQLRKKIEDDPAHPVYLKTVNYLGYVFTSPSQPAQ